MYQSMSYAEEIKFICKRYDMNPIDFIKRYTPDDYKQCVIRALAQKYNNAIPEREINKIGLTPRHVQVVTEGSAHVVVDQMED